MLILSRKPGEAICIGDTVELKVIGVSRGRVKLGFRASLETAIQRAELPARRSEQPQADRSQPLPCAIPPRPQA